MTEIIGPCYGDRGALTFRGRKVQCHICGSFMVFLGLHVAKTHEMSCDDYREQFWINVGLVGLDLRARMVRRGKSEALVARPETQASGQQAVAAWRASGAVRRKYGNRRSRPVTVIQKECKVCGGAFTVAKKQSSERTLCGDLKCRRSLASTAATISARARWAKMSPEERSASTRARLANATRRPITLVYSNCRACGRPFTFSKGHTRTTCGSRECGDKLRRLGRQTFRSLK